MFDWIVFEDGGIIRSFEDYEQAMNFVDLLTLEISKRFLSVERMLDICLYPSNGEIRKNKELLPKGWWDLKDLKILSKNDGTYRVFLPPCKHPWQNAKDDEMINRVIREQLGLVDVVGNIPRHSRRYPWPQYESLEDTIRRIEMMSDNNFMLHYGMIPSQLPINKVYMPVRKVDIYNDQVVKVTFLDGSFTKAVCSENDHFDLDTGITICLFKKMLESMTGGGDGSKFYNNLIRDVHQRMDLNVKLKAAQAKERADAKAKQKKLEAKRLAKKQKAKEEAIAIQKEAYLQAMKEHDHGGDDLK